MKTILKVTLLVCITLFYIQPVHGQRLLNKLREKVEEKVEERVEKKVEDRVDEKVDQAIDNQLDKIEESIETDEASGPGDKGGASGSDEERQERMQRMLKGMGIAGDPVPVDDSYSFNNLVQMHFESFKPNGNKENEGEFITHCDPQSQSMAYEMISGNMGQPGQGLFIVDLKNEAIIILSEENGKKSGIVYGMGSFMQDLKEPEEELDLGESPETYISNPNVTKTGRTKNIAGYKCDEYKYSDEESESLMWITSDLKLNARDFFSTLFKTSMYAGGMQWGYMMEMTTTDKETGERSFMEVTRVDKNSNTRFSLSDYQITNLGSLKMPKE